MSRPTLMFYCQHSLGMGHLVRSFALVRELSKQFRVVFLNGGRLPQGLAVPAGIEIVQLPALGMREDGSLKCLEANMTLQRAQAIREQLVLRTYAEHRPQALVIELFPFGRKKFRNELLPLLEVARKDSAAAPTVVCSLRDILVNDRNDQQRHDDRAAKCLDDYFDALLVHTDPGFARLEESFKPSKDCATPIHYTGFVVPHATSGPPAAHRERRILVSAGGGIVGAPLFRAALEAQKLLWPRFKVPMTVVAGPFLPAEDWRQIQHLSQHVPELTLHRSLPDLASHMDGVRWSLSQCGYNTAMDILASGVAALFVPFQRDRENEQSQRALKLAERGLALTVKSRQPDGTSLAAAILDLFEFQPGQARLDLDGARNTASIIADLVNIDRNQASAIAAGSGVR